MRFPGHGFAFSLAGGIIIVWLLAMMLIMRAAALPPQATGPMLAVFEPGTSSDEIFASLTRAGAKPIRETWLSFVWIVTGDEPDLVARLEANGALGAYEEMPFSPTLAGCFAYADSKVAQLFTIRP